MDQDPVQRTLLTYNQTAAQYAAANANMPEAVSRRAARLLEQIRPGGRILDLGCGPGRDLAWLAERGAWMIGVDLSSGMLAEARRTIRSGLCQMDMRRLGFADGSFAAVWCDAALLHLPKQAAPTALTEIQRVLVRGGRFFLSLQLGSGEGMFSGPLSNLERFFAHYEPDEAARLVTQAGFILLSQEVDLVESRPTWLWNEAVRR